MQRPFRCTLPAAVRLRFYFAIHPDASSSEPVTALAELDREGSKLRPARPLRRPAPASFSEIP